MSSCNRFTCNLKQVLMIKHQGSIYNVIKRQWKSKLIIKKCLVKCVIAVSSTIKHTLNSKKDEPLLQIIIPLIGRFFQNIGPLKSQLNDKGIKRWIFLFITENRHSFKINWNANIYKCQTYIQTDLYETSGK